jgi:hypothetical protein
MNEQTRTLLIGLVLIALLLFSTMESIVTAPRPSRRHHRPRTRDSLQDAIAWDSTQHSVAGTQHTLSTDLEIEAEVDPETESDAESDFHLRAKPLAKRLRSRRQRKAALASAAAAAASFKARVGVIQLTSAAAIELPFPFTRLLLSGADSNWALPLDCVLLERGSTSLASFAQHLHNTREQLAAHATTKRHRFCTPPEVVAWSVDERAVLGAMQAQGIAVLPAVVIDKREAPPLLAGKPLLSLHSDILLMR